MSDTRTITIGGTPTAVSGTVLKVGDKAPDFDAVSLDFKPVTLGDFEGKIVVFSSFLSVETGVCDTELRHFNKLAASLSKDVEIVNVSTDLPFSQKRWCGATGIDQVTLISDHKSVSFGKNYGVLLDDRRMLARCVFVVDKEGVIRYIELVPELGTEPDYDALMDAVKALV